MLLLNNVLVSDGYTQAATLGPVPTAEKILFMVANNSVIAQLAGQSKAKTAQDWSDEVLITPQTAEFQRIQGMRFKNAIPGSAARVVAMLVTPDDPVPVGGTPFTGQLAASGGIAAGGIILDYQQITANTGPAGLAEAAPLTILTFNPILFDGVNKALIKFQLPSVSIATTATMGINLWDEASDLGRLWLGSQATGFTIQWGGASGGRRLTPPAATKTYRIRTWGSGTIFAGLGGAGIYLPGYATIELAN